jgi:hypothetical protein
VAQQIVAASAARLLVGDVAWQFDAFERGFWGAGAISSDVLCACCFDAPALAAACCLASAAPPPTGPEVRRAFRVLVEGTGGKWGSDAGGSGGGGSSGCSGSDADDGARGPSPKGLDDAESEAVVVAGLWEVVDSWPPEGVARFVRFVTGTERCVGGTQGGGRRACLQLLLAACAVAPGESAQERTNGLLAPPTPPPQPHPTPSRLPPPGTEVLCICFPFAAYGPPQWRAALRTLPQAHTCTNTIELPDYAGALARLEGAGGRRLRARCRTVLAERLEYAIAHCGGSYALDE